jgi:hypothetical protein
MKMAIGHAARPNRVKRRRYEFVGWEFKPNKQGASTKGSDTS